MCFRQSDRETSLQPIMARAPFQVLVIPYRRRCKGEHEFAVFRRRDRSMWQFLAGGGEGRETPMDAARREAFEEAEIPPDLPWLTLDSLATVPRHAFPGNSHWPQELYVIPEHCFAVAIDGQELQLSTEHDSVEWLQYEEARSRLTWDSNRNALWELRERLQRGTTG